MRKKILISLICLSLLFSLNVVLAADEYSFGLEYEGNVIVNETKETAVTLTGINGPAHAKVRIKVEVTGPGTPTLMATDTAGNEYDIAKEGYWGPAEGFAVQGTFTNRTPVKATFPVKGEYVIKLSLIDLENADAVIALKEINVSVLEATPPSNPDNNNTVNNVIGGGNIGENNVINNIMGNGIEEIPKTGMGIDDFAIYGVVMVVIIGTGYVIIRKGKTSVE